MPTAAYLADALNLSPGYLGDLLKALAGQNTPAAHPRKAYRNGREKLSVTSSSVSEITCELGFKYSRSFN